ncbi:hypothetical protein Snov_3685 [Ancylobacter novellus DSM 506]|uniref:PIN like domain-containing protein n=1 Tax=Ancylobacter novellus (strain ATCC 8093 / DSM 506 / JCM 20403 / CCM 1077 / IAM 12100 / NBRC 12443 / NCIMB 10456) TaxID=639283 RepID=D7AAT8_ANCN5|nr:PIN-like domain-containing protein [Ancylobacter novellus]ADH90955.1 hypothetical protein Snov_3685 [Ancylobacter novellus DSM 506]
MRSDLFEYFRPDDDEFEELWRGAVVVPDANVLLNLFRYSRKLSEELIRLFESISDKIWIPHQVAYELLKNQHKVHVSMDAIYDKISGICRDVLQNTNSQLEEFKKEYRQHPSINFDEYKIEFENAISVVKNKLEITRKDHPSDEEYRLIVHRVSDLFSGQVGPAFSSQELEAHKVTVKSRYDNKIPPGYADAAKEDGGIGDFLIWLQILKYAKDNSKNIIFITEDIKEDWWLRVSGRTIGPRPELRREFYEQTGRKFYMYTLVRWLERARQQGEGAISEASVAEARAQFNADVAESEREALSSVRQNLNWINHYRHIASTRRMPDLIERYNEISTSISNIDDVLQAVIKNKTSSELNLSTFEDIFKSRLKLERELLKIRKEMDQLQHSSSSDLPDPYPVIARWRDDVIRSEEKD